ncbi:MAG: hypothetical protein KDA24_05620 [Deltaproteobacteria bacterium]|nr:hypothetical protein [Deltaproteobacteria bacterium]
MTRTTLLAALSALLFGLGTAFVPTTAQADPAKAETCLDELISAAVIGNGNRLRAKDSDAAADKEEVVYRVTLYKGMTYLLLGCADGEGVDLDLSLFDDAGELVDRDASPDAQPFVSVEPAKTGEYLLRVMVHKASAKTDFAVAVAYKD